MASNQEKGRAKNISNFETLCINVSALDAKYQPSNAALTAPTLATKAAECSACLTTYNNMQAPYTTAANNRKVAYAPISALLTRLRHELKASDFPKEAKVEAMINLDQLINKYKGKRAKPTEVKPVGPSGSENTDSGNDKISVAHLSCVQRANTLYLIIGLLANIPAYNPNTEELKLTSLADLHTIISTHNDIVSQKITSMQFARNALKESLNAPDTGLVDIALAAKNAIISAYGFNSFQYKQVSKLAFKREE